MDFDSGGEDLKILGRYVIYTIVDLISASHDLIRPHLVLYNGSLKQYEFEFFSPYSGVILLQ